MVRINADLAALVEVWPTLPRAVRQAIVTLAINSVDPIVNPIITISKGDEQ